MIRACRKGNGSGFTALKDDQDYGSGFTGVKD
jgi:hypothetical protein